MIFFTVFNDGSESDGVLIALSLQVRSPQTPDPALHARGGGGGGDAPPLTSASASWRRPTDLLPSHKLRIGFINNHTGELLNEAVDRVWE